VGNGNHHGSSHNTGICKNIWGDVCTNKTAINYSEMIAGIIIGPSILNLISPEVKGIDILAEFGVFFLLFFAGMVLD